MQEYVFDLVGSTAADRYQNTLVRATRYACGAADAWMNPKLPKEVRDEFLEAYGRYDRNANKLFFQAVEKFNTKIVEGESPDVLPLYIAAFLYYAAGVSKTSLLNAKKY
jgi:hypothetical protein